MNAAIRAAAKVGLALGLEMVGIEEGYRGLMEARTRRLDLRELDDAGRRGGTILGSARSKIFPTPEGQKKAREALATLGLKGLLVIGGNGSLTGARTLRDTGLIIGGLPASIDNDLACTSMAIGVDTSMNTIMEACDRLADTAAAHKRTFLIEVMGRDSGYLAMTSGVASGADVVLVPEVGKTEEAVVDQVVAVIERAYRGDSHKRRVLVIKSEGVKMDTAKLKAAVDARIESTLTDVDTRVTVLGHVVRGGAPTAFDRLLGARLANSALRAMVDGETDFMAGWLGPGMPRSSCKYDPYVVLCPLEEVLAETARLHRGEGLVAEWRRKIFREIEPILAE
jgi:6-phosphofructokinase 1